MPIPDGVPLQTPSSRRAATRRDIWLLSPSKEAKGSSEQKRVHDKNEPALFGEHERSPSCSSLQHPIRNGANEIGRELTKSHFRHTLQGVPRAPHRDRP